MKKIINTTNAPAPIGPYSHSVVAEGKFVFISGQLPLDATGKLVGEDIVSQTTQSIKNLQVIIEEAGGKLSDIVKTTVLLSDLNNFSKMNEVYSSFFGDTKPARASYQVARLPQDVLVEIEAIACID